MLPPPPHHQLKADDIRAVEAELFDSEVLHPAVKNRDAAAVSSRHLCLYHTKPASFPCVNFFCEICFLEYHTIHLSLLHPAKCRFQTPVLDVSDVERSEPDQFLRLPPDPPHFPGTPLCRYLYIAFHRKIPPASIFLVGRLPATSSGRAASLPLIP